jgi:hypothetical protein
MARQAGDSRFIRTEERPYDQLRLHGADQTLYVKFWNSTSPAGLCDPVATSLAADRQSSRRIDNQTIEVLRNCGPGVWTGFVRRAPKDQLVLEISEQRADGRRFDRRLIFEKQ